MVVRDMAFLVFAVLSLTIAKVDSTGLLVRICWQWRLRRIFNLVHKGPSKK